MGEPVSTTVLLWTAIATVSASLGASLWSSTDAARRAQHAAEDAAAQNKISGQYAILKRDLAIEQARTKYIQGVSSIMAQAGKAGIKLAPDSSPGWLIEESKTNFYNDVKMMELDTAQQIQSGQYATGQGYSEASAKQQLYYAGAFQGAMSTAGRIALLYPGSGTKVNYSEGNYNAYGNPGTGWE